uniref:Uncharacterized protein n=1 Tax=Anguilla anguilla TaxID=7936 RepID=A0A0E9Q0U8_ANGAN
MVSEAKNQGFPWSQVRRVTAPQQSSKGRNSHSSSIDH